ncbi:MAG: glyoxylate/hydroxypyruvate reductase A [Gammaproteobacteria bacterium]|nr:glyoxylate/hydroxypyruvate reductase A [Gammaproteobacteria bacterium]
MKTIALFHADSTYIDTLLPKFQAALPTHTIKPWQNGMSADYLVTWKPRDDIFATDGLKLVFGLGAGVDAFLNADLDDSVSIVRLEEAGMGDQMLEVALYGILHHSRDMIALNQGQRDKKWLNISTPKKSPFSTPIGILGLGQLGGYVATALAKLGYPVSGYSQSKKHIDAVNCYCGDELDIFLANSEVLINLLPLTPATKNILNKELFAKLPQGAYIVNIARGKHLVEEDLIPAMNNGQISGALLDVFQTEPLPKEHDFWNDNRITITPHLAAITLQDEAVRQISNNILAYESGRQMTGVVDRNRGY